MATELLYNCPVCGRENFMLAGLRAHRCHVKVMVKNKKTGRLEYPQLTKAEMKDAVMAAQKPERACRKCGCTEQDCSGCIGRTGRPCYWVEKDLCSACAN